MNDKKNILITGESGFIGSHLIRLFVTKYPNYSIHGLDSLTYASNRDYTKILESSPNYQFHKIDICNRESIMNLFMKYNFSRSLCCYYWYCGNNLIFLKQYLLITTYFHI